MPAASLMSATELAIGSARFFSPVISFSKLLTVSSNCFWCLTVVSSTVFRFLITSPIAWSRSASAEVSERGLVEDVVDGAALALEDRDDRLGDVVDLVGVQRAEQRPEAADQRVEVERGLGALDRDGAARGQLADRCRRA